MWVILHQAKNMHFQQGEHKAPKQKRTDRKPTLSSLCLLQEQISRAVLGPAGCGEAFWLQTGIIHPAFGDGLAKRALFQARLADGSNGALHWIPGCKSLFKGPFLSVSEFRDFTGGDQGSFLCKKGGGGKHIANKLQNECFLFCTVANLEGLQVEAKTFPRYPPPQSGFSKIHCLCP